MDLHLGQSQNYGTLQGQNYDNSVQFGLGLGLTGQMFTCNQFLFNVGQQADFAGVNVAWDTVFNHVFVQMNNSGDTSSLLPASEITIDSNNVIALTLLHGTSSQQELRINDVTGLTFTTQNDTLHPRLVIDTMGFVGIGTAQPSATLDIFGSFRLLGTTYSSGFVNFEPNLGIIQFLDWQGDFNSTSLVMDDRTGQEYVGIGAHHIILNGPTTLNDGSQAANKVLTCVDGSGLSTWTNSPTLFTMTITGGSSEPGSPAEGQLFYNTSSHQMEYWNGTAWVTF